LADTIDTWLRQGYAGRVGGQAEIFGFELGLFFVIIVVFGVETGKIGFVLHKKVFLRAYSLPPSPRLRGTGKLRRTGRDNAG